MNMNINQINYKNHMANSTFPAIPKYSVLMNKESEANTSQSKALFCKQTVGLKGLSPNYKESNETAGEMETLLVVDDEKSISDLCRIFLENLGYTVLTANAPYDAIRLAKGHNGKIQMLITDIRMPQMNGLELAEQLSSIRAELKCVFMSGYSVELLSNQGMLNKEINFLQKPFTLNYLAEKVRNVLNQ